MANSNGELERVNWGEVFSFSHIFKSFRMAIHPSKLLLGLAVILTVYFSGRILDSVWSMFGRRVQEGDVVRYVTSSGPAYSAAVDKWREDKLRAAAELKAKYIRESHDLGNFKSLGLLPGTALGAALDKKIDDYNDKNEKDYAAPVAEEIFSKAKTKDQSWSKLLGHADDALDDALDKIDDLLDPAYDQAKKDLKSVEELKDDEDKMAKAEDELEKQLANAERAVVKLKVQFRKDSQAIRGRKVFESFLAYEINCFTNAISAVRYGNFTTGVRTYRDIMAAKTIPSQTVPSPATAIPGTEAPENPTGFLFWVLMALQGVIWLFCTHWVFAVLFLGVSLAAWSLFGGAIHRIAALHAAREEKISIAQALRFSADKFLSFFTAPLIPLAIVLFLGLFLFAGGLIGNIWGLGAVIVGILFPIAILLGLLIAFLLIGLGGGAGLMYPTIAVEGSDSFDAISRSFSYVFARPWRASLYAVIALVYGTICYLFVRLFALVALAGTHWFAKGGMFGGGKLLAENADKMDLLWPAPTFANFHPPCSWAAMSGMEAIAAFLIAVWVYLVIGLVAAFTLSFFASSTTVIYYLLRRKVDATDLDDVYVEEVEEEEMIGEGEEAEEAEGEEPETEEETPAEEEPAEEESEEETEQDEEQKDEGK